MTQVHLVHYDNGKVKISRTDKAHQLDDQEVNDNFFVKKFKYVINLHNIYFLQQQQPGPSYTSSSLTIEKFLQYSHEQPMSVVVQPEDNEHSHVFLESQAE